MTDPTLPEPIDAAGLRQKVQVLIGALSAEVVRLREENERLRNTVGAQETAIAAVDNWLLEHGDTTHLLSRVEHLDAFMAFAAEQAVSTLKAAAEGMAEALEAIATHGKGVQGIATARIVAANAIEAYRSATSGAG